MEARPTWRPVTYNDEDQAFTWECPHCDQLIQCLRTEINCAVYRHSVDLETGQQINPHLPKEECDRLIEEGRVYGCCKPFRFVPTGPPDESGRPTGPFVEQCDYI